MNCECNTVREDARHYFIKCAKYYVEGHALFTNISNIKQYFGLLLLALLDYKSLQMLKVLKVSIHNTANKCFRKTV